MNSLTVRVGQRAINCLLDGYEWNKYPEMLLKGE